MPVADGAPDDAFGDPLEVAQPASGAVSAPLTGPDPSSMTPDQPTEPPPVADEDAEAEEPLPEFDPRHREALEGLLFLGRLETTFRWVGHEFRIKTLTVDELLEVGLLQKPYQGSFAEIKAYQAACCAACVVSVDRRVLTIPVSDETNQLEDRFNYIREHWFPPTLDKIYEEYLLLESKVNEVLTAMGKAPG